MKRMIGFAVCLGLCASGAMAADMMKVGSKEYKGTFEGYEKNIVKFRLENGTLKKETRSRVRELKMEEPRDATYTQKGRAKGTKAKLVGYKGSRFVFNEGGKERTVPAMMVTKVTVPIASSGGGGGLGEVMDGGTRGDDMPIKIDVSGLGDGEGLEPNQLTALNEFKAARSAYNQYVSDNIVLVRQMDAAKGAPREKLLNQLRLRKQDEQPIKARYKQTTSGMIAAFPELAPPQ